MKSQKSSRDSKQPDSQPTSAPDEPSSPEAAGEGEATDGKAPVEPKGEAAGGASVVAAKRSKKAKFRAAGPKKPVVAEPKPKPKQSRLAFWAIAIVLVVAIVVAAVIVLVRKSRKPQWSVGNEVPVEITVVAADRTNLACSSPEEVAGKRCAFEANNKAAPKPPAGDTKTVLQPYTTTDRHNLLVAGLWSSPALAGTLPSGRFSVKCTFVIEGIMKQLAVRWSPSGQWSEPVADWRAGTVKDCTLIPPAGAPSAAPLAAPSAAPAAPAASH